jgi:hypothetical protein
LPVTVAICSAVFGIKAYFTVLHFMGSYQHKFASITFAAAVSDVKRKIG